MTSSTLIVFLNDDDGVLKGVFILMGFLLTLLFVPCLTEVYRINAVVVCFRILRFTAVKYKVICIKNKGRYIAEPENNDESQVSSPDDSRTAEC